MRAADPSPARQRSMLARLRGGLVLAGADNPTLRHLERRRLAHGMPLHDPRNGKPLPSRAWQITAAGVAEHLGMTKPGRPRQQRTAAARQIDIEEAIASASSEGAPECASLREPASPVVTR